MAEMERPVTHTPGRLEVDGFEQPNYSFYELTTEIYGKKCTIANVFRGVRSGQSLPAKANSRRLAACWNALAGIPVEAIEAGIVEEMVGALRAYVDWMGGEASGPDYGAYTSRTHPNNRLIWQTWWNEQLRLCDRATTQARAVLSKLSPPTDRGEE